MGLRFNTAATLIMGAVTFAPFASLCSAQCQGSTPQSIDEYLTTDPGDPSACTFPHTNPYHGKEQGLQSTRVVDT